MDLHTFLVLGHVIGTVLGAGGALLAEAQIIQALRDGRVDASERALMHANYTIIRIGTALIILSGIALVWWHLSQGNTWVLTSGKLWVKEIMTIAIIVNAILLTKRMVPLWLGSAISFASWWGALVLGVWRAPYSFETILISYIISIGLIAGILHVIRAQFIPKRA